jgi:hypothetical protein
MGTIVATTSRSRPPAELTAQKRGPIGQENQEKDTYEEKKDSENGST